jgi:cell division protein FtsZ
VPAQQVEEAHLVAAMTAPREVEIAWPTARADEPVSDDLDLRLPQSAMAKDEDDAPMFAQPHADERSHKPGFFSLFGGRPRYEAPQTEDRVPQFRNPRAAGGAGGSSALAVDTEAGTDEAEDLEIPSFLRRLAN